MVGILDTQALRASSLKHNWMHNRDWIKMAEEGDPLVIVDGKGLEVIDSDGNSWLDVNGGYLNVNVGYGRTEIADAVLEQMLKITFTPRGTTTPPIAALSEKLAQITPGDLERSWAVTGGSEANETAIKIAKAYHKRNGEAGRYKIISRKGSYHGALGLTTWLGGRGGRSDFEPPYPGMLYAPQPNPYRNEFDSEDPSEIAVKAAQAVEDLIVFHGPETVAAVIAEPVCADTPVDAASVPGAEYWPMLRQICDRYGVLLIDDEVICGFGRTGKWFGITHWDVVPDIMTVAKGVVSTYLPMAAAIASRRVADAFAGPENIFPMTLTFGGHPVTAAAALANIKIIEEENLVENAAQMGAYLLEQLRSLQDDHPTVGNVRGLGLINAVEIVKDRQTKERFPQEMEVEELLAKKFAEHHLILRPRGTIVIAPPLCVTRDEVDRIVNTVDIVLGEMESELGIKK